MTNQQIAEQILKLAKALKEEPETPRRKAKRTIEAPRYKAVLAQGRDASIETPAL